MAYLLTYRYRDELTSTERTIRREDEALRAYEAIARSSLVATASLADPSGEIIVRKGK